MHRFFVCLIIVAVAVSPTWGANLLPEGEFDTVGDYVGWLVFDAALEQWSGDADVDGCPGSGAATGATGAVDGVTRATLWSPCVPVGDLSRVTVDFDFFMNGTARSNLVVYGNAGCSSVVGGVGGAVANGLLTSHYRQSFSTLGGQFARLVVSFDTADGQAQFYVVDRVHMEGDDRVFSDDFEGAATCRWSAPTAQINTNP